MRGLDRDALDRWLTTHPRDSEPERPRVFVRRSADPDSEVVEFTGYAMLLVEQPDGVNTLRVTVEDDGRLRVSADHSSVVVEPSASNSVRIRADR